MNARCAACGAQLTSFDAACAACGARPRPGTARTAVAEQFASPGAETVATPPPPPGPQSGPPGHESRGSSIDDLPPVALGAASNVADDPLLQGVPLGPQGKVLGGVKLIRRLGAGGMGAVYAGQHLVLDTTVAIKILPVHLTNDASYEERFKREARLSFEIVHPNIVRTLHAGKEHGLLFLQMEFVDGTSAGELVRSKGRLQEALAVQIVLDAARGLAAAHAKGIIHRDVKPDNILVARADGRAKIADLGLARVAKAAKTSPVITGAGTTLGTPAYMAPEQIEDASLVGAAADIYSLGATLFEMVCARPPFAASTIPSLFREILDKPAPDPNDFRPDLSAPVRAIIRRCLEKKPAARFASADELCAALEAALPLASKDTPPRVPVDSSRLTASYTESDKRTVAPTRSEAPTLKPPRAMTKRVYAAIAVVVVLALVGGFWLGTEAPGPPEKRTLLYGVLPDRRLTTERLKALEPVTTFLEKATRRKWEPWVGATYEDNIDAFARGKLDLGNFGGVTYVLLKQRESDAIPLVQRDVDQKFQALFVVPASSPITKLEDLRGKQVAFVDELSTSGFVMPAIELLDAGVNPVTDVKGSFVHDHDTVLREVASGGVEAGVVDARVKELLCFQGKIDREKVKELKRTAPFPDDVWVASPKLEAKIRARVLDAFKSLDATRGTDGQTLSALEANHYIEAQDSMYDDLRAKVKRLVDAGVLKR